MGRPRMQHVFLHLPTGERFLRQHDNTLFMSYASWPRRGDAHGVDMPNGGSVFSSTKFNSAHKFLRVVPFCKRNITTPLTVLLLRKNTTLLPSNLSKKNVRSANVVTPFGTRETASNEADAVSLSERLPVRVQRPHGPADAEPNRAKVEVWV